MSGEAEAKRRSAYGRGLFDGLRIAGVGNPGDFMNEAKLTRMESGLNTMAKKVLDAVPIQEQWPKEKIVAELRRTGCNAGINIIEGCLDSLRGSGLIAEPDRGQFVRKAAKPKITHQELKIVPSISHSSGTEPTPAVTPAVKADPFSRIAAMAGNLRTMAADLEAVACDVEEMLQTVHKDTEKMRQLQALLKSIGQ